VTKAVTEVEGHDGHSEVRKRLPQSTWLLCRRLRSVAPCP
jgi:hypothetical protein